MYRLLLGRLLVVGAAVALGAWMPYAAAQSVREGRTAQDRPFIAGGIGLDESEQMKSMARDFPLSITMAAKSGAYLSDSHIKIQDARGKMILDTQLDAPYLLVDLLPGKYNVEATLQGKKQQRSVEVAAIGRSKVLFSFDVPVDQELGSAPIK